MTPVWRPSASVPPTPRTLAGNSTRRSRWGSATAFRAAALVVLATSLLAACNLPGPTDVDVEITLATVEYDGTPKQPELVFDPPSVGIRAVVTVTPVGGAPLPAGTWPSDAGVYEVHVATSGGRTVFEGSFTIAPRAVSITPHPATKRVGQDDPTLTFASTGLLGGDVVTGSLGREPGETTGSYAFTLGDLTAGSNYALSIAADAPVFVITEDGVSITVTSATTTYDGTAQSAAITFDPAAAASGAVVTYGDLPAGTHPVDAGTYAIAVVAGTGFTGSASGELVIAPRPVTITPATASKRLGEADPTFTFDAAGLVGADAVSGSLGRAPGEAVGHYAFTIDDLTAGPNYVLSLAADAPEFHVVIDDALVDVASTTVSYDGTPRSLEITFDPPEAASGAIVTYGDLPAGTLPVDAGTYAVTVVAGTGFAGSGSGTLIISPRELTLSGFSAPGKTYDGTATVPAGAAFDDDRVAGDDLTFSYAVAYASSDAGDSVAVDFTDVAISGGADAANYTLATTSGSTSAVIAPATLTLSAFTAPGKTYDGTVGVPAGAAFADDRLSGDDLEFSFDVEFNDANAGAAVAVEFGNIAISGGTDAGNYALATTSGSTTASIAPRPVSLLGAAALDKTYDGTTAASVTGSLEGAGDPDRGIVADDHGSVGFQASFAQSDAASDVAVSVALTGPRAANYLLEVGSLSADITPRALTVTADDHERVYGVANPTLTYTLSGFAAGEDASSAGVTGAPALSTTAVTTSLPDAYDITVDGVGTLAAANYAFADADTEGGTLTVVKRPVSFDIANKGAGLDDADLTYTSAPLAIVVVLVDDQGDVIDAVPANEPVAYDISAPRYRLAANGATVHPAQSRADIIDAGMYWVTIEAAFGIDDPRYDVSTATNIEVYVAKRALSVGVAHDAKIYGDDDPSFSPVAFDTTALATNDAFTAGTLTRADGATVGTYHLLPGSLGIESTDALRGAGRSTIDNYDLTFGTFEITPAPLTVTADEQEKVYGDVLEAGTGYTAFTAVGLRYDDTIDSVSVGYGAGALATDPVDTYPAAIVPSVATGDAFDASNYDVTYVAGDLDVTPRALTISASDQQKVYGDVLTDGAGYTAFTSLGLQNDETIGSVTVAYGAGNAGTDPVGDYEGVIALSDATGGTFDPGNYTIAYEEGDLEIMPRALTITASDQSKEYDRTLSAGAGYDAFTSDGLQNGETIGSVSVTYTAAHEPGDVVGTTGAIVISDATGGTFDPANYDVTYVDGTLTVIQRPIAFDVANYDVLAGDVRVFMRDGLSPIGYSISSDPAGVTAYTVSYRRTNAADGSPIPLAQQPVPTIQLPGTYRVTIRVADPNYVDDGNLDGTLGDASVRTVWVNDATHVAFTDASSSGALVGGTGTLTLQLRGADGFGRAGPAPITLQAVSGGAQVALADSSAGHFDASASLSIAPFHSTVDLIARADALSVAPVVLSASADAPFTMLAADTAPFTPAAVLAFAAGSGWSPEWQVGSGALSGEIVVALQGAAGVPVVAPGTLRVDLSASPGASFHDVTGTALASASVDVAAGSSSAAFRVVADAVGTTTLGATHAAGYLAVAHAEHALTVTPRPTVTSVSPAVLARSATSTVSVFGSDFQSGAWSPSQVSFGAGVAVSSVARVSASRLDVGVTVDAGAALGERAVTVTNADGGTTSLASAFTVLSNPSFASVSPNAVTQGTSASLTVSGSGFETATLELGPGITVTGYSSRSATHVTANVSIAPDTQVGNRVATLRNVDDQAATFNLTVLAGLSVIDSVQLGSGYVGQWVEMVFFGTGMQDAMPSSPAWANVSLVSRSQSWLQVYALIGESGSTAITMTTPTDSVAAGTVRRVDLQAQGTATASAGATWTQVASYPMTAGVTYYLDLEGAPTPGASLTLRDPVFELRSASGQVAYDDDGGIGLNSQITYTPAVSGTFTLWARNFAHGDSAGTVRWTVSR